MTQLQTSSDLAPPRVTTAPSRKGKQRCRYCNETLHWLGAGWGHDSNDMACCMFEIARTGKVAVAVPR